MANIIVLDELSDDGLNLLRAAADIEVEVRTGLKGDALKTALAEFDGAICRSGVKITAESLQGNHRLKAIARAGVGVDNIDTAAATRQGIVVMNTPGGNTISTAEQTLALMYGLVAEYRPGLPKPGRRPLGPQEVHGHATRRQNAGHRRSGTHRPGRRGAGGGHGNEGHRLRSVRLGRAGQGARRAIARLAGGTAAAGRHSDGPYPSHRPDQEPHRRQRNPNDEEGGAAHQLRPRRHLRRSGVGRRPQERAPGRRGPGRLL